MHEGRKEMGHEGRRDYQCYSCGKAQLCKVRVTQRVTDLKFDIRPNNAEFFTTKTTFESDFKSGL